MSQPSKERRAHLRARLSNLKLERGCAQCGFRKHPAALHFHHLDPTEKAFSISQRVGVARTWGELQVEIEKCIVLCANCHAVIEAEKRGRRV